MSSIRHKLGLRIRALREGIGISQEELGYRSGLHRTYIGSVERGERNVSIDSIEKIARGLRVEVKALFNGIK